MKIKFSKVVLSILALLSIQYLASQVPQQINYQAIVRNSAGTPITTGTVSLRFIIHDGSEQGNPVYQEIQSAQPNQFGLVTVAIGSVSSLSNVIWATGLKYLEVDLDATGGNTFTTMGNAQLLSVPYALYAANGVAGPTGATGNDGPIGATGLTGATGVAGNAGVTGATGATGNNGAVGATGIQGLTGANGITGAAGATGNDGLTGTTGPAGATGATGNDGVAGATGIQGPTGANGVTGADGTNGSVGVTGATGAAGAMGATGNDGAMGATGLEGITGATGAAGSQNAWGLTGNTGTSAGNNFIGTIDANDLVIKTNNTERVRVSASGNVGIGTSAPTDVLELTGPTGSNAVVTINQTGAAHYTGTKLERGGTETWFVGMNNLANDLIIRNNGAANVVTVQNSTGNVGLGTGTPATRLDIENDTTSPAFRLVDGTQAKGSVLTGDSLGNASWSSVYASIMGAGYTPPVNFSCMAVINKVATGTNSNVVTVAGNYAYVSCGVADTLLIFNLSNPALPVLAGKVATGSGPQQVAVSGNYAYLLCQAADSMQVINISNPASPVVTGSVATGQSCTAIAVSGNYAYVANQNSNTMQVINVSNPASPVVAGSLSTGNNTYPDAVAVSGNYAYLGTGNHDALYVVNISNPANPTIVDSLVMNAPFALTIAGNYIYEVGVNALQIINISNPLAPVIVNSQGTPIGSFSITVTGNYAFVNCIGDSKIRVYNVTNPASPVIVGDFKDYNIYTIAARGNYLYAADSYDQQLQVIPLSCTQALTVSPQGGFSTENLASTGNVMSGSGTNNYVTKFTGTSNIGNSILYDNGSQVGIGTASPQQNLSVENGINIDQAGSNSGSLTNALLFGNNSSEGIASQRTGSGNPSGLDFYTNNISRISINNNGNVGIGTNAPQHKFSVLGDLGIDQGNTGASLVFGSNSGQGIASPKSGNGNINGLDFSTGFTVQMSITPGGNVGIGTNAPAYQLEITGAAASPGGGSWIATSDKRLKQDVKPYTDGLQQLLAINPVTYHYNQASGYDSKPEYVGVIAQDLKEVAPYMVGTFTKQGTEYYNVNNSAITYMLLNSVKEQQKMIDDQKQVNALQQQQIDELKKEIEYLKKK